MMDFATSQFVWGAICGLGFGAAFGLMMGAVLAAGARADEMTVRAMERENAVRERLHSGE